MATIGNAAITTHDRSLESVLVQCLGEMTQLERKIERMLLLSGFVYHRHPAATNGGTRVLTSRPTQIYMLPFVLQK